MRQVDGAVESKFELSDSAAVIQWTAASPFDGGSAEIDRRHASGKFRDAALDAKT
jgi:hypothetical protein